MLPWLAYALVKFDVNFPRCASDLSKDKVSKQLKQLREIKTKKKDRDLVEEKTSGKELFTGEGITSDST